MSAEQSVETPAGGLACEVSTDLPPALFPAADDKSTDLPPTKHPAAVEEISAVSSDSSIHGITSQETGSPTNPEAGSPAKLGAGSPGKVEAGSPGKVETGSPAKLGTGSPPKLENGSPAKLETGSPAKLETGSPAKPETGSPTKLETVNSENTGITEKSSPAGVPVKVLVVDDIDTGMEKVSLEEKQPTSVTNTENGEHKVHVDTEPIPKLDDVEGEKKISEDEEVTFRGGSDTKLTASSEIKIGGNTKDEQKEAEEKPAVVLCEEAQSLKDLSESRLKIVKDHCEQILKIAS